MSGFSPDAARAEWRREPHAGSALVSGIAEAARELARPDPVPGAVCALGIDPGPVPGFFLALWRPGEKKADWARAWQCNADGAGGLLAMILSVHGYLITCGQIEEFRTGRGPGTRGRGASATREMVSTLTATALAADRYVKLAVRHSSAVMPWSADKRLAAAGILDATAQLPHARAASRHALYCAAHDGGLPDPLSRRAS